MKKNWFKLEDKLPEFHKPCVWRVKRHGGFQVISGQLRRNEKGLELALDNDMVYSEAIGIPHLKAHWAEIPEFK